jgi:rhodanese-related sulfurtransferase
MDTNIPSISPQQLLALRQQDPATLVIDVRREPVFRNAPDRMTGALRHDPAAVAEWGPALPPAPRIVVYCVHGHEVSQNAAKALCEHGLAAQYLEGGIEAWRAAGGAVEANNNPQAGEAR